MKSREKRDCWIYAICMMLLVEIFSWFQPIYTNIDNFITSMVIGAVYDKDTYSMVLNPVLCWVLSAAEKILPEADVFTWVTKIVLLAGIGSVSYFVALHFRHWAERLFAGALLFLLIIEMHLFSDFFMVWSAFFAFVGMVWLLRSMKTEVHGSWIVAGTFFICCGLMWRLGGFVPFIPFLVLGWGMDFLFGSKGREEKLKYLKKTVRVFGPMALCFIVLLGIDYGYKHSEKYEDSVNFCDAVSSIVDYPMKEYEEVRDLLPGVSENDYTSLAEHMYADTDRITTEYCLKIAEVGKKTGIQVSLRSVFQNIYSLTARFYGLKNFRLWCIALGIMALWIWTSKAKWYEKLKIVFAGMGAYMIMLYLMILGRLPERGMQVVVYAVMGILVTESVVEHRESKYGIIFKAAVILLTGMILLNFRNVEMGSHQSLLTAKTGASDIKWEDSYVDDVVYIWKSSDYKRHPMKDFMEQGKLMSQDFMNHHVVWGEWYFNQVYYKNYMDRLGVPNLTQALMNRENTYYVAQDCNSMWTYLKEHYGENVQVVQVDELDGIPVWQFQ